MTTEEIEKGYHDAAKLLFMVMHSVGEFHALGFNRQAIENFCKQYVKDNKEKILAEGGEI